MNLNLICITIFLLGCMSHQRVALADDNEDNWIEPDTWAREHYLDGEDVAHQSNIVVGGSHSHEAIALVYYKKFIAHLFNAKMLKYDEATAEYRRALLFTILPEQLTQLKELNDPRDLDSVLTDILLRARTPEKYDLDGSGGFGKRMGVLALVWDILKDFAELLKRSEIQFLLGVCFLICVGWFCHRRYGIGIITMIVSSVAVFGYFHTYLECNRKLEAERLLEIMTRNAKPTQSWYSPIAKFFSSNHPQQKSEQDYIRKASLLNLPFCRPDHVFILYVNDLFLKQLEFLLDKCTTTMETLMAKLKFPFNYVAAVVLVFLIGYIVKLTFKYVLSPRAWIGLFQARAAAGSLPAGTGTAHHEDRVSGENLRLLLNVISGGKSRSVETAKEADAAVTSGVQEVLEPIEAGAAANSSGSTNASKTSSKSNTPDTSLNNLQQSQNNNNGNKAQKESEDKCKVSPKDKAEVKGT